MYLENGEIQVNTYTGPVTVTDISTFVFQSVRLADGTSRPSQYLLVAMETPRTSPDWSTDTVIVSDKEDS